MEDNTTNEITNEQSPGFEDDSNTNAGWNDGASSHRISLGNGGYKYV